MQVGLRNLEIYHGLVVKLSCVYQSPLFIMHNHHFQVFK